MGPSTLAIQVPSADVAFAIVSYSLCSGSLILINKLTVHWLPFPSTIIFVQLLATIGFVLGGKFLGLMKVDSLESHKVVPYMYYVVAFSLGVYASMRSLATSNVETVIVFRACTPILVSVLDAMFLGRALPSTRSWLALITIVVGAYGYAHTDYAFQTLGWSAYWWPTLYLFLISFEMTYGKKIVSSVRLETFSGPVLYTNLLGAPPMFLFAVMAGEFPRLEEAVEDGTAFPAVGLLLLFAGCVVGTGISYSGWYCRSKVSATSYTLVGVMNKCLTVLFNQVIWDQHASMAGVAALGLCLVGGMFYEQAPMRKNNHALPI